MIIYGGKVVRCYPKPPGGCRTNVEMTINEVADACDTQGMHQAIFYGNHAPALRTFCQLYGIEAVKLTHMQRIDGGPRSVVAAGLARGVAATTERGPPYQGGSGKPNPTRALSGFQ